MSYNVFHRTWWISNPEWPDGKEPGAGRKTYIARRIATSEEARSIAQTWNANHNPGKLSRKAEFEEN